MKFKFSHFYLFSAGLGLQPKFTGFFRLFSFRSAFISVIGKQKLKQRKKETHPGPHQLGPSPKPGPTPEMPLPLRGNCTQTQIGYVLYTISKLLTLSDNVTILKQIVRDTHKLH